MTWGTPIRDAVPQHYMHTTGRTHTMRKTHKAILFLLAGLLGLLALASCGETADSLIQRGLDRLEAGDYDEVVLSFEKALELEPDDVETLNKLGLAHYKLVQLEQAIEAYTKALAIEPDNVDVMTNLGAAYYRFGQLDNAIEIYNKAIAIAPDDAGIRSNLAAAYFQKYQPEGPTDYLDLALEQWDKALELQPDLAEAYYGRGAVFLVLKRADEAIAAFEKFQELDTGTDPDATLGAQQILNQLRGQ
jgi:tetratricopeptide (TPR) repeat protein